MTITMRKYLEDLQAKGMTVLPAELKIADVLALYDRIEQLEDGLEQVASGQCCMTEGCSTDDPKCDVMIAKAALQ